MDDSPFFGFKTHIAINDERLITAAIVTTGEQSDGKYLLDVIEKSQETGMEMQGTMTIFAVNLKRIITWIKERNEE